MTKEWALWELPRYIIVLVYRTKLLPTFLVRKSSPCGSNLSAPHHFPSKVSPSLEFLYSFLFYLRLGRYSPIFNHLSNTLLNSSLCQNHQLLLRYHILCQCKHLAIDPRQTHPEAPERHNEDNSEGQGIKQINCQSSWAEVQGRIRE